MGGHDRRVFSRRLGWLIVGLAFAIPIAFAAFTHHAWEDYFITLRTSRNLVEGYGPVFNPGERVHTFTSPLGMLVPALCTAIVGVHHEIAALWLFRLFDAGLLSLAAWLLWRRADSLRLGGVGRFVLFGLLLADAKLTDFAINGMETAMLVFLVLVLWTELESPTRPRTWVVALAIGGLMWTRPDAFVLIVALLGSHLCIRGGQGGRIPWPTLVRALVLGGLVYLPWFVFAWWYYGSPVPHTVVAKGAFTAHPTALQLLALPWHVLIGDSMLLDVFMPAYWNFGGWPRGLTSLAHILSAIAALAWIVPRWSPVGRRASLAVFIGMFYVCSIILFPWYVPPWTALSALALAFLADHVHSRLAPRGVAAATWRIGWVAAIALQVCTLGAVAWQMRIHQLLTEDAVRRDLGEWLGRHAHSSDTLFLEPLGYIGYFSQLKTYDFPGLSSPKVVAAIRSGARNYAEVIERLKPDWVVLRPAELRREEFRRDPVMERDYEYIQAWDARPELDATRFVPGRAWLEWEAQYLLFHRKDEVRP